MQSTISKPYKKYLWEVYSKNANIQVTRSGKIVRVDVSGPKALEKRIGQLA